MLILKKELPQKHRMAIIALLIFILGSMTYYFQLKGISTVFTHLYYIPIIIACIWWQRKAYAVTTILGIMLIIIHLINNFHVSIAEDLLRIGIMLAITSLCSELSISEKKYNERCISQSEEIEKAYAKLKEEDKELNKVNLKLKSKLEEIERLYKVTVGRELEMAELKKKNQHLN